jgi:hypothetical protein
MGDDEAGVARAVSEHRRDLLEPILALIEGGESAKDVRNARALYQVSPLRTHAPNRAFRWT